MPEKDDPRFEKLDADVRSIIYFGIGLVVMLVVVALALIEFEKVDGHRILHSPHGLQVKVPPPQLQRVPAVDLATFHAAENAQLREYRWIDRRAGVVQIPIERAMDLTVERGLPVRSQGKEGNR